MPWQCRVMITSPDPFALSFDSIEIDPARAPSPAAIESAFAAIGPTETLLTATAAAPEHSQPGYFLLDDANGRFTVDREFGVVTLSDDALLTREHGAVHPARLRVVEPSGASYDLDLKLRITGHVPQMLGAEDFGFGGDVAPVTIAAPVQPPTPRVEWARFAPALGAQSTKWLAIGGAYGSLIGVTLPAVQVTAAIALSDTIPTPSPTHAVWLL